VDFVRTVFSEEVAAQVLQVQLVSMEERTLLHGHILVSEATLSNQDTTLHVPANLVCSAAERVEVCLQTRTRMQSCGSLSGRRRHPGK
jgi:hypothetical protein